MDAKERFRFPKDEQLWTMYQSSDGTARFAITSKAARDVYFLYELGEKGATKLGKATSPRELEEKFDVYEKISEEQPKPKSKRKEVER